MEFIETTAGESREMPAKIVIFGEPKLGKTTFACDAENPFLIDIEGGAGYLAKKVRSTPKLNSYDEVIGWLRHIYENDAFKAGTIIVDSLDWLESLAQARLIKLNNAKSITDPAVKEFAYFKGVLSASEDAIAVLRWLDAIFQKKKIKSILIAHSQIKTVDLPNQEPYSRHEMKLSKYLAARTSEWADIILYAGYSFHISKEGKTSEPKRVLFTGGSASFVGGSRMVLDKELPLNYKQLEQHITKGK